VILRLLCVAYSPKNGKFPFKINFFSNYNWIDMNFFPRTTEEAALMESVIDTLEDYFENEVMGFISESDFKKLVFFSFLFQNWKSFEETKS
jgi:hypothetical protein